MIETNLATVPRHAVDHVLDQLRGLGVHVDDHSTGTVSGRTRVPAAEMFRLWDSAARKSGDPLLGIRVAHQARSSDHGLLWSLLRTRSTLGEALIELCRMIPLTSDAVHFVLVVDGDRTRLELGVDDPLLLHPLSAEHIVTTVFLMTTARSLAACPPPVVLHFAHSPSAPLDDYASLLGVAVRFDTGWNGIELPTESLLEPRSADQPGPSGKTRREAEAQLREQRSPTFVRHVRQLIRESMRRGERPSVADIAGLLALHPKSLARRLAARGTTFTTLLEQEQLRYARKLLDSSHTVDEIAEAIGYADGTAFARAFKRWTGASPSAYRDRAKHRGSDRSMS